MRQAGYGLGLALFLLASGGAQERRVEPVEVWCPEVLGIGSTSQVPFCDVVIEVEPDLGIHVILPPRRGDAVLSFNLHNRHIYSQQEEQAGRAYRQYLASVAVATMDGEVIGEGVVLSEFRSAGDLVDRILGGAGVSGLKAVAPTGTERVLVTVPAGVDHVSIVGERLEVVRMDGRDVLDALGRPIAVISEARVDYRPR